MRYYKHAKNTNKELFIALGIGGTPSSPDELLIIPARMISLSKCINQHQFTPCHCEKTPEAFHQYISNYFSKRILK